MVRGMPSFASEDELEEYLSRPSAEDIACVGRLGGDYVLLGAGGKMGPTLAMRIRRALDEAGVKGRVIAVSRFSDAAAAERLRQAGVEIESVDLLDESAKLPDAANVIYLAGRKFGSTGAAGLTWVMNVVLPDRIAKRYRESKIAVLSSGNIYPHCTPESGGATEETPVGPVGEYAQTVLGRERMFEHHEADCIILRLNYAVEPRYGVPVDIATKVWHGEAVPLEMGYVNVIWQGDANSYVLRALEHTSRHAPKLNLAGREILTVRSIAEGFGKAFGRPVQFSGAETPTALLNDSARCTLLLGAPRVKAGEALAMIAAWMQGGGRLLNKPTHFEAKDGKF
jgi:nucleoside-diphosphate-sugar epimerase